MIYKKIDKKVFLYCFVLLVFSCQRKKHINKFEGENLCQITKEIIEKDQKYRGLLQNPFFEVLDSILTSKNMSMKAYAMLDGVERDEYGDLAKNIAKKKKRNFTQIQKDSIMKLQIQIDNENTEMLIEIIKNRGLPNEENSKCKEFPGHVFLHSQPIYWDEIKKLIDIEKANGNMDEGQYKLIMYHIKGRDTNELIKE